MIKNIIVILNVAIINQSLQRHSVLMHQTTPFYSLPILKLPTPKKPFVSQKKELHIVLPASFSRGDGDEWWGA